MQLIKSQLKEVDDRLKDALERSAMIPLRLGDASEQVGKSPLEDLKNVAPIMAPVTLVQKIFGRAKKFWPFGKGVEAELPPQIKIIEVFRWPDVSGRLLILGHPGAGKTTTLLELAQELLVEAKELESKRIPHVFELSRWEESMSIVEYLAIELERKPYYLDLAVGRGIAGSGQLLPLFDGLDELRNPKTISTAMVAINEYLKGGEERDAVVCCRMLDYGLASEKLRELNGAIELQPLSEEAIQEYLKAVNKSNLWALVEQNPALLKEDPSGMPPLLKIPLFLSVFARANPTVAVKSEGELWDAYIVKQLGLSTDQLSGKGYKPYKKVEEPTQKQSKHYLIFLAQQLQRTEPEFLVQDMDPDWLTTLSQRWKNSLIQLLLISIFLSVLLAAYLDIHQGGYSSFQNLNIPLLIFSSSTILFQIKMTIDFKNHLKSKRFKDWLELFDLQNIGDIFFLMFFVLYGMGVLIFSPFVAPFIYSAILSLRITLYLSHQKPNDTQTRCIPWNYARFLSYAADRKLLQQTGGSYRFIHRSLLEHFAGMEN
ncbi:MAG: hypothetical protein NT070_02685 [Cyanobacteria bacterium]|nr:hypothetical protein [Cyanobacteriota bacterium]